MTRTVYLAGAIADCDAAEANDWRDYARRVLAQHNLIGISPLRFEPLVGERYGQADPDPMFGTARVITAKNLFDLRNCDMTLVRLPREYNDRRPSYGTVGELVAAKALNKTTVLVTDDPKIIAHPLLNGCADWVVDTLDKGLETVIGLMGDYARRSA